MPCERHGKGAGECDHDAETRKLLAYLPCRQPKRPSTSKTSLLSLSLIFFFYFLLLYVFFFCLDGYAVSSLYQAEVYCVLLLLYSLREPELKDMEGFLMNL
jgi:hypothetical protein